MVVVEFRSEVISCASIRKTCRHYHLVRTTLLYTCRIGDNFLVELIERRKLRAQLDLGVHSKSSSVLTSRFRLDVHSNTAHEQYEINRELKREFKLEPKIEMKTELNIPVHIHPDNRVRK